MREAPALLGTRVRLQLQRGQYPAAHAQVEGGDRRGALQVALLGQRHPHQPVDQVQNQHAHPQHALCRDRGRHARQPRTHLEGRQGLPTRLQRVHLQQQVRGETQPEHQQVIPDQTQTTGSGVAHKFSG